MTSRIFSRQRLFIVVFSSKQLIAPSFKSIDLHLKFVFNRHHSRPRILSSPKVSIRICLIRWYQCYSPDKGWLLSFFQISSSHPSTYSRSNFHHFKIFNQSFHTDTKRPILLFVSIATDGHFSSFISHFPSFVSSLQSFSFHFSHQPSNRSFLYFSCSKLNSSTPCRHSMFIRVVEFGRAW